MAADKSDAPATAAADSNPSANTDRLDKVTSAEYEAVLSGVIALAALFSNCVEAFGQIHAGPKWMKEEQLLLSRLGVQQARLLIWGDIVGICSPPRSVTDRAVPRHPSAAYPDVKEPTFFAERDARLEETGHRVKIESALNNIVDRSHGLTREQMMERFGLRPPKRYISQYQPAIDVNRLEGFREKYELLQEVAETYAQINARRQGSITTSQWLIADTSRFGDYIKIIQESVDTLVDLMEVHDRLNRAMRMDIRALGWHLTADKLRVAQDISKLRLMQEVVREEYPVYAVAIQEALNNIEREKRENAPGARLAEDAGIHHYEAPDRPSPTSAPSATTSHVNGGGHRASLSHVPHSPDKQKRPGLLGGLFRSFRKEKAPEVRGRSASVSAQDADLDAAMEPERSFSESGPARDEGGDLSHLKHVRSKSLGDIQTPYGSIESTLSNKLARMETADPSEDDPVDVKPALKQSDTLNSTISRHDQYHGIARTETKDLWQGRYNEAT